MKCEQLRNSPKTTGASSLSKSFISFIILIQNKTKGLRQFSQFTISLKLLFSTHKFPYCCFCLNAYKNFISLCVCVNDSVSLAHVYVISERLSCFRGSPADPSFWLCNLTCRETQSIGLSCRLILRNSKKRHYFRSLRNDIISEKIWVWFILFRV